MSQLNIAYVQLNPTVGDIAANLEKILENIDQARRAGAQLVIFPELCLTAYPPEDLLLRDDFMRQVQTQAKQIEKASKDIAVIAGIPIKKKNQIFNCACVFNQGKLIASYAKRVLPNYAVFDEQRYFSAGQNPCVVELHGVCIGLIVCEDIWQSFPIQETKAAGAQLIVSINASPFCLDKYERRLEVLTQRAADAQCPIIYVNQVGGQDELVFDGASCLISAQGKPLFSAPVFAEGLHQCSMQGKVLVCEQSYRPPPPPTELIWGALVTGLGDYITKNRISGVVLGLSGGIDSAVTLALAVEALGKDQVMPVMLPSAYTSDISVQAARQLAKNLNLKLYEIPIQTVFESVLQQLAPLFADAQKDTTEENIQSRIRGLMLMAIANKYKKGLLATGNKSEMAVGYATLYGDMAGALAPLKDVIKRRVYELAQWYNHQREIIPEIIIKRPPSAELAHGQLDQDRLPPYELLDPIIEAFIESDASCEEIVAQGFSQEMVEQVQSMILGSEFKRRQSPPGIKVTSRAFGKDRRYPITSGFCG